MRQLPPRDPRLPHTLGLQAATLERTRSVGAAPGTGIAATGTLPQAHPTSWTVTCLCLPNTGKMPEIETVVWMCPVDEARATWQT